MACSRKCPTNFSFVACYDCHSFFRCPTNFSLSHPMAVILSSSFRQNFSLSHPMAVILSSGVRQTEVCRTSFNFHLGQLLVLLPTVMHSLLCLPQQELRYFRIALLQHPITAFGIEVIL